MLRLLLLFLLVLALCTWPTIEETGSKGEYAALQAISMTSGQEHILIGQADGKTAVGIPSTDKQERIWTMLRAFYPPRVKVLHTTRTYRLSPKEFEGILRRYSVSREVAAELHSHVQVSLEGIR